MARLWAKRHPTICIHPGWPAIAGRSEVVESWRRILANPRPTGHRLLQRQGAERWIHGLRDLLRGVARLNLCGDQRVCQRARRDADVPSPVRTMRESAAAHGSRRHAGHRQSNQDRIANPLFVCHAPEGSAESTAARSSKPVAWFRGMRTGTSAHRCRRGRPRTPARSLRVPRTDCDGMRRRRTSAR